MVKSSFIGGKNRMSFSRILPQFLPPWKGFSTTVISPMTYSGS